MSDTTYGVVELTAAINDSLRDRFGSGVWVVGEISGLVDRGPHTYFTLVEESADGKCAQFRRNRCQTVGRFGVAYDQRCITVFNEII